MFIPFFLQLKDAKVPVTLREFLALLEGMEEGIADFDVEAFYFLARTALVKDERHIDKFDRVFSSYFQGLESVSGRPGLDVANIPEEWLRKLTEKHLTDEEKKLVEALGGFEKLMETLRQRLEEQKGRHQGGSKWIGTGGTSPFGAYGYNPEGVRIGQDQSRHRRAVKVWDKREFADFDDKVELGTRNIKLALKRLRRWVREGAVEEFDLPGTIRSTAEHGYLDVQTRPERRNAVKLLMFFDVGGSMDDHIRVVEELFSAGSRRVQAYGAFLLPQLPLRGCVEGEPPTVGPDADARPHPQLRRRLQGDLRRRRLDEPLRDHPYRRFGRTLEPGAGRGVDQAGHRSFPPLRLAQSGAAGPLEPYDFHHPGAAADDRADVSPDTWRVGTGDPYADPLSRWLAEFAFP